MRNGRTEEPYLTTADVAERYGIASETVRSWIERDDLPAFRIGNVLRIAPAALREFERKHTIGDPSAVAALLDLRERVQRRLDDERGAR